ncbi:MAG: asparagine synthase (glutamine-hydrolyzing) [Lasallia pustulata]|uniref:asparagine synthase (glutamine-hydrolyzing) n=1 Tax=Lasallia pustulata TaxID=136370 RepID=A0A5M8Q2H4_9LECA|nr:MAG: asparagine synthase (glutamine-hydrolyzing) [Lasallia pustulata]
MCGIFACHCHPDVPKFKPTALQMAKAARHRGPDWSGNYIANNTILVHERLSIVGVESGAQPLLNEDGSLSLAVNGEIYNHRVLRKQLKQPYIFKTHSDCEVIIPLYMEHGLDAPKLLDGMFSWVLYDKRAERTIAARDPRNTLKLRSLSNGKANGHGDHEQQPSEGLVGVDGEGKLSSVTWLPQLHSFSIGLPDAPDTKAALEVAKFLGTKHYDFTFTIEDGLSALSDVIYHLESYDVTTIRASTPMFLLSRKIKAMGVKMGLGGEGSDEIFGGYLYFHAAPDKKAFHEETVRRVKNLHLSDCLRANKSTAAWGVEARVPFLDKQFLEDAMSIDPSEKMITKDRIEKYILRKAFDTTDEPDTKPYLPDNILWRQKEQFSDGVGYGWIDALKDNAALHVTDEMMQHPKAEWGDDMPDSKEAYWYRSMFDEHFPPYCASTVMRWTPTWSKQNDPSGRAIATHVAKYGGSE